MNRFTWWKRYWIFILLLCISIWNRFPHVPTSALPAYTISVPYQKLDQVIRNCLISSVHINSTLFILIHVLENHLFQKFRKNQLKNFLISKYFSLLKYFGSRKIYFLTRPRSIWNCFGTLEKFPNNAFSIIILFIFLFYCLLSV